MTNDDMERNERCVFFFLSFFFASNCFRIAKSTMEDMEQKYYMSLEQVAMLEAELESREDLEAQVQRLKDELRDTNEELAMANTKIDTLQLRRRSQDLHGRLASQQSKGLPSSVPSSLSSSSLSSGHRTTGSDAHPQGDADDSSLRRQSSMSSSASSSSISALTTSRSLRKVHGMLDQMKMLESRVANFKSSLPIPITPTTPTGPNFTTPKHRASDSVSTARQPSPTSVQTATIPKSSSFYFSAAGSGSESQPAAGTALASSNGRTTPSSNIPIIKARNGASRRGPEADLASSTIHSELDDDVDDDDDDDLPEPSPSRRPRVRPFSTIDHNSNSLLPPSPRKTPEEEVMGENDRQHSKPHRPRSAAGLYYSDKPIQQSQQQQKDFYMRGGNNPAARAYRHASQSISSYIPEKFPREKENVLAGMEDTGPYASAASASGASSRSSLGRSQSMRRFQSEGPGTGAPELAPRPSSALNGRLYASRSGSTEGSGGDGLGRGLGPGDVRGPAALPHLNRRNSRAEDHQAVATSGSPQHDFSTTSHTPSKPSRPARPLSRSSSLLAKHRDLAPFLNAHAAPGASAPSLHHRYPSTPGPHKFHHHHHAASKSPSRSAANGGGPDTTAASPTSLMFGTPTTSPTVALVVPAPSSASSSTASLASSSAGSLSASTSPPPSSSSKKRSFFRDLHIGGLEKSGSSVSIAASGAAESPLPQAEHSSNSTSNRRASSIFSIFHSRPHGSK